MREAPAYSEVADFGHLMQSSHWPRKSAALATSTPLEAEMSMSAECSDGASLIPSPM
jgi:hypothetical protein